MGLVDYDEPILLWRIDKRDFVLWTITCITTLFLGIEIGLLVGVGVSLAFVIHESANPHIGVLGRLLGTTIYRNIEQYPEAYTYHGIVIVRVDAPIYFANTSCIKDRLREYEANIDGSMRHGLEVDRVYYVIVDLSQVTYMDSSAVQALKELYHEYRSRDIQIVVCNPNGEVLLTLTRAGLVALIGREWYLARVHDAVQICLQQVQSLNERATSSAPSLEEKPSYLRRLPSQRNVDLEYGDLNPSPSSRTDSELEQPLLHRKP